MLLMISRKPASPSASILAVFELLLHFDTFKNIDLFSQEVLPHLRDNWPEWENRWWPESLRHQRQLSGTVR